MPQRWRKRCRTSDACWPRCPAASRTTRLRRRQAPTARAIWPPWGMSSTTSNLRRGQTEAVHDRLQRPGVGLAALGGLLGPENQVRQRHAGLFIGGRDDVGVGVAHHAVEPALGPLAAQQFGKSPGKTGDGGSCDIPSTWPHGPPSPRASSGAPARTWVEPGS